MRFWHFKFDTNKRLLKRRILCVTNWAVPRPLNVIAQYYDIVQTEDCAMILSKQHFIALCFCRNISLYIDRLWTPYIFIIINI